MFSLNFVLYSYRRTIHLPPVFRNFIRIAVLTHFTSIQGFTKKEFAIYLRLIWQIWCLWRDFLFPVPCEPFKPSVTPHLHRSCALATHVLVGMTHTSLRHLYK